MTLSKLITANNLEAMAAPEIKTRATVRRNEAVFCTVDGDKFDGSEYASAMLTKVEDYSLSLPFLSSVGISAKDAVC